MIAPSSLLIRDAELLSGAMVDVRLENGRIAMTGSLYVRPGELVIDAQGGLLLPGLHDHHIHLAATAAARQSVACGPPNVIDREALAAQLARPGEGWLRGVGYHESVAGMLDRDWLDSVVPDRPVRIQHRGGRMWFLNSAGLHLLLASKLPPAAGLDRLTGRLFDEDAWLRGVLGRSPPSLKDLGADLARLGITGVTDMNPANGPADRLWLAGERLPQRIMLAGGMDLANDVWNGRMRLGPVKVHLHEAMLIEYGDFIARIAAAHVQNRGVAVHCVTEVELIYTLAALREAGGHPGDRIEHASVTPDILLAQIAAMGLAVVTQPLFPYERGDAYRRDIAEAEWPHLYRLSSFINAGTPLAGGSDAPYGSFDPWAAMKSAVTRRTLSGSVLGTEEALTPEQALALYLADPGDLRRQRQVVPGEVADLCLLDRGWAHVRHRLSADEVRLTLVGGAIVHERVDQSPP